MVKKKFLRNIFAATLLATLVVTLAAAPVLAQDVQPLPNSTGDYETQTSPYEGQNYRIRTAQPDLGDILNLVNWINSVLGTVDNLRNWIKHVAIWGLDAIYWTLSGQTYDETLAMASGDTLESYAYNGGGALGTTALALSGIYANPPNLHTAAFFRDELADNILANKAQAAEVGTSTLEPIKEIWQVLRNVAYTLFVLFLIVMGLMIMTRYRIDPRTVMTVSNALPRIAMSLVLVAFSYPIAGFLVDIMNLLIGLINSLPLPPVVFELPGGLDLGFTPGTLNLNPALFTFVFIFLSKPIINPVWLLGSAAATMFGGIGLPFLGGFLTIELLFRLILFFLLIFLIIKLVYRYVSLFVLTIFSPLAFAWGVLPGQEDTISRWFKSFLVSVLSFPGVLFILYIGYYLKFLDITELPPPLAQPPGGSPINLGALMYLGVLLIATRIPEMIEDALEVTPKPPRGGLDIGKLPIIGGAMKAVAK